MTGLFASAHRSVVHEQLNGAGLRGRRRLAVVLLLMAATFALAAGLHRLGAATAGPNASLGRSRELLMGGLHVGTRRLQTPVAAGVDGETAGPLQAAASQSTIIHIKNFAFGPASVTVAPGQQVTWVNDDPVPHTATSAKKAWDTGPLQSGGTFSVTFTKPGTYVYTCTVHPFMQATITVR